MIISRYFIEKGATRKGVLSSAQIKLIGAGWPPMKGWKKKLEGKYIDDETANLYLKLKGVGAIKASKIIASMRKDKRMQDLNDLPIDKPIDELIREKIKTKPINHNGLIILNSYLEILKSGNELKEYQISIVKKMEELYKDTSSLTMDDSYVYLVYANTDERGRTIVKIGFSKNPKQRVNDLKTANPKAELIAYEHGSKLTERKLHIRYESYCIGGEWFSMPMSKSQTIEAFRDAVKECKEITNNLPVNRYRDEMIKRWGI